MCECLSWYVFVVVVVVCFVFVLFCSFVCRCFLFLFLFCFLHRPVCVEAHFVKCDLLSVLVVQEQ